MKIVMGTERSRQALVPLTLAVLPTACSDVVTLPIMDPVPVVHGMLVAGEGVHEFIIERSTPFGRPVTPVPSAFDAADVDLTVFAPDGGQWALEPRPQSMTVFVARGEVVPGATYVLAGQVAHIDIRAAVTVPSPLVVDEPSADTVALGPSDTLRLMFSAPGALGVFIGTTIERAGPGTVSVGNAITRQGVWELPLGGFSESGDNLGITLMALDTVTTRNVESSMGGLSDPIVLPSNVEGGAGVVSGATVAERAVLVR